MRVIIIGAGPCGLGAAHRLTESGHLDYTVYDRNPYVGGLATSFRDEKGYLWDFAVHVAHSHYEYVDKLMDSLLPDGFYYHERRSWVRAYNTFIPYPFQYNVRHLPPDKTEDCVQGLLGLQKESASEAKPPQHFKDWILNGFGQGIADHFMIPYNEKIWSVPPEEMGYQWIGDRVPTVDVQRVIDNITHKKDDVSWGPNSTFQFPKTGGTGAIWKALAARLPPKSLRLSCGVTAIDSKNKTITLDDGTVDRFDMLISTMPITRLTELCGDTPIHERASGLKHTRVTVVGVAPQQPIPDSLKEKTWLYCPEPITNFYRVTPFSIFSPDHVPDVEQQCSLLCEISKPGHEALESDEDIITPTLQGLRDSGLIDCDPATTHIQVMHADYGYPIPTCNRDDILNDVIPALEAMDIFSRGRFGGWKYEVANMDHSVMQGVEAVDRILTGKEERTWRTPNVVNAG